MTLRPVLWALKQPKLPIWQGSIGSPYLTCIIASQQLGYLTSAYGFISPSLSPVITKRGIMADYHALILP